MSENPGEPKNYDPSGCAFDINTADIKSLANRYHGR